MLYDADKIEQAASTENIEDLYQAQLDLFLDPHDPAVIEQARKDGIPENWITAAQNSPVYKMAMEWKVAFPLHPEYRTLPMVWYIPPLSPLKAAAEAGKIPLADDGIMPDLSQMRIPVKYLANLLTAGKEEPVELGLRRMMAMRHYMRSKLIEGQPDSDILYSVGLTPTLVEDMYKIMAIANYEDRFVIPTGHREETLDAYGESGGCGFSFGNGCSGHSNSEVDLFQAQKQTRGRSGSQPDNRINTIFSRDHGGDSVHRAMAAAHGHGGSSCGSNSQSGGGGCGGCGGGTKTGGCG
jgi:nitrate reductase beta subunit